MTERFLRLVSERMQLMPKVVRLRTIAKFGLVVALFACSPAPYQDEGNQDSAPVDLALQESSIASDASTRDDILLQSYLEAPVPDCPSNGSVDSSWVMIEPGDSIVFDFPEGHGDYLFAIDPSGTSVFIVFPSPPEDYPPHILTIQEFMNTKRLSIGVDTIRGLPWCTLSTRRRWYSYLRAYTKLWSGPTSRLTLRSSIPW